MNPDMVEEKELLFLFLILYSAQFDGWMDGWMDGIDFLDGPFLAHPPWFVLLARKRGVLVATLTFGKGS